MRPCRFTAPSLIPGCGEPGIERRDWTPFRSAVRDADLLPVTFLIGFRPPQVQHDALSNVFDVRHVHADQLGTPQAAQRRTARALSCARSPLGGVRRPGGMAPWINWLAPFRGQPTVRAPRRNRLEFAVTNVPR